MTANVLDCWSDIEDKGQGQNMSYYVIVLPWAVRLYVEIIQEHKRVDYLTYRWTNMV